MISKDLANYGGFPDDHKKCSVVSVVFTYYDYEVINRDLNKRFTGLEHLKIETRLIDERFESVKGECVI
jgi:hypothetical protein